MKITPLRVAAFMASIIAVAMMIEAQLSFWKWMTIYLLITLSADLRSGHFKIGDDE